jgi:hypothetical protein
LYGTRLFFTNLYGDSSRYIKTKVMAQVQTKLPKIEGVGAVADASALAMGELTLSLGGNDLIDIKVSDIINWSYDAYTAGTIEVVEIDLSAAVLLPDNTYSMTVRLPNTVNFFGGGGHGTADARESRAVYVTRTYTVSTDATPLPGELADELFARMSSDLYAPFTVVQVGGPLGTTLELTACDATAGAFEIDFSNIPGVVLTVTAPNVLPVGEPTEVDDYVNASLVTAASYDRHVIKFRKYVRHNAVKGLEAVKEEKLIVFSDTAAALNTTLGVILDGTYTPVADYLGAPMV